MKEWLKAEWPFVIVFMLLSMLAIWSMIVQLNSIQVCPEPIVEERHIYLINTPPLSYVFESFRGEIEIMEIHIHHITNGTVQSTSVPVGAVRKLP